MTMRGGLRTKVPGTCSYSWCLQSR